MIRQYLIKVTSILEINIKDLKEFSNNIKVVCLNKSADIFKQYKSSMLNKKNKIYLFVEDGNKYI